MLKDKGRDLLRPLKLRYLFSSGHEFCLLTIVTQFGQSAALFDEDNNEDDFPVVAEASEELNLLNIVDDEAYSSVNEGADEFTEDVSEERKKLFYLYFYTQKKTHCYSYRHK